MVKSNERTWFSLLLGIVIVTAAILTFPRNNFKAQGILLPTQKSFPAITPKNIILYGDAPAQYQSLGTIHITQHYTGPSKQVEQDIVLKAKQMAAKVGANGIIVKLFGHSIPGAVSRSQAVYMFSGTAIYIPKTRISHLHFYPTFILPRGHA